MEKTNGDSCLSLEGENEVTLTPLEYNHILDIQQKIFELLIIGYNEKEVLDTLCQMAEKLLPNSVASVMLLDHSTGLMNVISAPSIPPVGHEALKELKPGPRGGSCGNAVFRNEAQYVQDTKTDERWSDLRQVAYDFNLCSCWSMPIRNTSKEAIGSFALSSFEHRSPSGFHKRLLKNCAFIVNLVLKRSEYEHALEEKQKQLSILATAMKNASDGMVITDQANNIIEVNDAFLSIFGITNKSDVVGKNPKILASGKHNDNFYRHMWESLKRDKRWSGEVWNKRVSGEIFPEWLSITTITAENGEVQNYLAVFTDLSELHQNQEKIVHLAYYDQLTQLPNRQKLILDLNQLSPSACAIINIDDFKEINDFFGIELGDTLLQKIADFLTQLGLNPYRIGGDEFAMLFYNEDSWDHINTQLSSLMSKLSEHLFIIEEQALNVRISAGVAIGGNKLLTRADIALHTAKEQKLHIALYQEDFNVEESYRSNIAMARCVRKALSLDNIICHYQPIVNNATGKIEKYETLVRMKDDNGNIIPPMEFLSVAKKTKLYPQITRRVVDQACRLFSDRQEFIGINLSDSDIRDPKTVDFIIQTITQTKTAPRIVFEIIESEGIENFEEVAEFIQKVKNLGSKIAIDDFGTGYSNFENILKLGVDFIKIDGSLIRGITNNERHRIIIDTIVDFANKIGAKIIAEYVSDEEIYEAVKNHGIHYSQGYFTGKPGPL